MGKTVIKNGLIVDGTGDEAYPGHLMLENDRISALAPLHSAGADELLKQPVDHEIDASGKAVTPGFIDCHSHFDWMFPLPRHQDFLYPMIEQGITTVVTGNCGFSPFPVNGESKHLLQSHAEFLLDEPLEFAWTDFKGYRDFLNSSPGLLFNFAQLAGHGAIQIASEKSLTSQPGPESLKRMIRMTEEAFEQGAFGLSLGLMYPPGIFSRAGDLEKLAKVTEKYDRVMTVHNRALSKYSGAYPIIPFFDRSHSLKAMDEVLRIALNTGVKTQISHLMFAGRKSWPLVDRTIALIEKAGKKGARVKWDLYPHFCGNSYLVVFLPPWFVENLEANLENPGAIRRLKMELNLAKFLLGFKLSDIQIMEAHYPEGEKYNGLNIQEIADMEGIDPVDAMLMIVKESRGKALQLTWGYSGDEDNERYLEKMLGHPLSLFETDTILLSRGFPNPCSYGAFPRVLGHYVRDRKVLSLTEAVSKMTGLTADWFGIKERGVLKPGNFADIVIFDPETIADTTTRKQTNLSPTGIHSVFINGEPVVEKGRYMKDKKQGRALARN